MAWWLPQVNTAPYEEAAKKYSELAKAYSGEEGQKKASAQAAQEAKSSATSAGAGAMNQALNAGYSRAKAARMGQNASAQQYSKAYDTGYQNAVAMNDKAVNAQGQNMQNVKNIEDTKYQNDAAIAQGVGNVLAGVAGAISDRNCKDISAMTPAGRIAELKARLEAIG